MEFHFISKFCSCSTHKIWYHFSHSVHELASSSCAFKCDRYSTHTVFCTFPFSHLTYRVRKASLGLCSFTYFISIFFYFYIPSSLVNVYSPYFFFPFWPNLRPFYIGLLMMSLDKNLNFCLCFTFKGFLYLQILRTGQKSSSNRKAL